MEFHQEIHDMKLSLARIELAVIGDEEAGISGLAKRTKDLESYQKKDQRLKHKVAGGLFISIPIIGTAWEFVKEFFWNK